jgi:exodeoxyribonuclease-5
MDTNNLSHKVSTKFDGYGFTDSQKVALNEMETWMRDKTRPSFTLSGRAGTGKTYILNYFINKIVNVATCVTAPTHKAVRNVERITQRKGKTLQSLHGLRPNTNLEEFNIDRLIFDTLGQPTISNYRLVIIDECSMVNSGLHTLNINRARDLDIKILYVGDPMQLPPVNESISPTFVTNSKYELTEIVRQDKDNPLVPLLEQVVMSIIESEHGGRGNGFLHYLKNNPEAINSRGEGYKLIRDNSFVDRALELYKSDEFSTNPDFLRIAAWKNDTVLLRNKQIRNSLIPHFANNPEANINLLDINDLLIGYRTLLDEYNSPTLVNSEDYAISELARVLSDDGFYIYRVKLMPRWGGSTININIVDHSDTSFKVYYEMVKKNYVRAKFATASIRSSRWKDYFEYKNRFLSLTSFPITVGQDSSKDTFVSKDIDYGFALTTHKLQGSTISNSFVDLYDMLYYSTGNEVANTKYAPTAITIRNKLIYTALSRASKFAYINVARPI